MLIFVTKSDFYLICIAIIYTQNFLYICNTRKSLKRGYEISFKQTTHFTLLFGMKKFLTKLKCGKKIRVVVLSLIAVFVVAVVMSVIGINTISNQFSEFYNVSHTSSSIEKEMQTNLHYRMLH